MGENITIKKIQTEIYEINSLISKYSSTEEIPKIELDLVLEKLRKTYNSLFFEKTEETKLPKVESEKKGIEEKEPVLYNEPDKEKDTDLLNIDTDEKAPEDKSEIDENKLSTLADKYKSKDSYLNESITSESKPDVASKLQSKPIEDIGAAIGLNERFLFTNELFNGDSSQYNQIINKLNEAANFNEAYNYLFQNFDWDMDSEVVQKLLELVRRKHIISTHE